MSTPSRTILIGLRIDPEDLEKLEAIVSERDDTPPNRSALIRDAISWLLVREATWLIRRQAQLDHQAEREARHQRALDDTRSARDRQRDAEGDRVEQALEIVKRKQLERSKQPPSDGSS